MGAAGVWIGGIDPAGNLKLACTDYPRAASIDFWAGPLDNDGLTDKAACLQWDRFFKVTSDEIRQHLQNLAAGNLNPDAIPVGVKGWPARGNPYFSSIYGFSLPGAIQGLAGFFDANNDGIYNPLAGDYPALEINGCDSDRYPDEMIFWIFNDQGGGAKHGNTNTKAIQAEIQALAFGYATNVPINDMTFYRFKMINRAKEALDSTFFALWIDPDLGCYIDDYFGFEESRDLFYVYNRDEFDGSSGCTCFNSTGATFCDKIPMTGIDLLRGPLTENGEHIGVSSFIYFNNLGIGPPPQGTQDPSVDLEFYRYLNGYWRDGTPLTYGGNGRGGTLPAKYAFPSPPNDPTGWSMCTANLPYMTRRILMSSGPFRMIPGTVNELIYGLPWVAKGDYPCPDLLPLFKADDLAQQLFDNCFDLTALRTGPDAPDIRWISGDGRLEGFLSNKKTSNNYLLQFEEPDYSAPQALLTSPDPVERDKTLYKFEDYIVYQLIGPDVTPEEYGNPNKARVVAQSDVKNGIIQLSNWITTTDPLSGQPVFGPVVQVNGADQGIRHQFAIDRDLFAFGPNKKLVNNKTYYYSAVAYAHNNYANYQPLSGQGQARPFLAGSRNVRVYAVTPKPNGTVVGGAGEGEFGGAGDKRGQERDEWELGKSAIFPNPGGMGPVYIGPLPAQCGVRILDTQGRPIWSAMPQPAAGVTLCWIPSADTGRPLPPGIYWIQLETPAARRTLKWAATQ